MGYHGAADVLRGVRLDHRRGGDHLRTWAREDRARPVPKADERSAFLYERAAAAVARLRQEIDRDASRSS